MFKAFNRSFPTYDEAYNYCVTCDFDTSFIKRIDDNENKTTFQYEMLYRPCAIGCQPKGFIGYDETKGDRYGVLTYDRQLTQKEIDEYELKPL